MNSKKFLSRFDDKAPQINGNFKKSLSVKFSAAATAGATPNTLWQKLRNILKSKSFLIATTAAIAAVSVAIVVASAFMLNSNKPAPQGTQATQPEKPHDTAKNNSPTSAPAANNNTPLRNNSAAPELASPTSTLQQNTQNPGNSEPNQPTTVGDIVVNGGEYRLNGSLQIYGFNIPSPGDNCEDTHEIESLVDEDLCPQDTQHNSSPSDCIQNGASSKTLLTTIYYPVLPLSLTNLELSQYSSNAYQCYEVEASFSYLNTNANFLRLSTAGKTTIDFGGQNSTTSDSGFTTDLTGESDTEQQVSVTCVSSSDQISFSLENVTNNQIDSPLFGDFEPLISIGL